MPEKYTPVYLEHPDYKDFLIPLLPARDSGAELFAEVRASMQTIYPLKADLPPANKAFSGNEDID